MPETPAVDLDAIRARLDAPRDFEPVAFDGTPFQRLFMEDEVRALLGMVDTLTAERDEAEHSRSDWLRATFQAMAQRDTLTVALERTRDRFVAAVAGRPIRDMAETLAEVDAALVGTSPTPPARDLVALADQWTVTAGDFVEAANGARAERDEPGLHRLDSIARVLLGCASELRAALGVPRSAGHEEDPVRTATPRTERVLTVGMHLSASPCVVVVTRVALNAVADCRTCKREHWIDRADFERGRGPWRPVGGAPTTEPGDSPFCTKCGWPANSGIETTNCTYSHEGLRDPDTTGDGNG